MIILMLAFMFAFTSNAYASATKRLAGDTRYDTAVSIAQDGWKQSDYALLAYGESYPDALSAAPLAKKYNAPILLTNGKSLPSVTKQTLLNLQVKTVLIIGGTGVIPSSIDAELQSMNISVTRIAGYDRYATAIKVAQQLPSPTEVFVVTGEDYPDALSIAPIAALKQEPIILVPKDTMPDSVKAYLSANTINKTYVVGNSDVISNAIVNQLPSPERIIGVDRYARNININLKFDDLFSSKDIGIATGKGFADALTGTAYAAKFATPIILVNFASPTATKNYYQQRQINANNVYVFGGTAVLSDSLIQGLTVSMGTIQNNPVAVDDSSVQPVQSAAETPAPVSRSDRSELVEHALSLQGVPYLFGGTSRSGFDCSGYAQYVFKGSGISLPRMACDQYKVGSAVSQEQLQAGDLVFFTTYAPGASHVGIYIGDGHFVAAANSGVSISSLDSAYYKSRYLGARRVS